jgi:hypothetical protein
MGKKVWWVPNGETNGKECPSDYSEAGLLKSLQDTKLK